jgi:hypothetical protein
VYFHVFFRQNFILRLFRRFVGVCFFLSSIFQFVELIAYIFAVKTTNKFKLSVDY